MNELDIKTKTSEKQGTSSKGEKQPCLTRQRFLSQLTYL